MRPDRPIRAVIPAAGRGTRLWPATLTVPKELLPVAGVPMIQRCVEEALESGIRDIAIVVARGKESIREHFETEARGAALSSLRRIQRSGRLRWILQDPVTGLADAFWLARSFCADQPFAALMPDNVFLAASPPIAQLMAGYAERPGDYMGATFVTEVEASSFSGSGRIECAWLDDHTARVTRLLPKRRGPFRVEGAEPQLRTVGRSILTPRFFEHIATLRKRRGPDQELDDIPILQRMVREGGVYARVLVGSSFDAGNHRGLLRANRCFAEAG